MKHGVSQRSIFGPLLLIIYINNLPPTLNTLSGPILFSDETRIIISNKNLDDFSTMSNTFLSHTGKWLTSNRMVLNLDKTNIITFIINKSSTV